MSSRWSSSEWPPRERAPVDWRRVAELVAAIVGPWLIILGGLAWFTGWWAL